MKFVNKATHALSQLRNIEIEIRAVKDYSYRATECLQSTTPRTFTITEALLLIWGSIGLLFLLRTSTTVLARECTFESQRKIHVTEY